MPHHATAILMPEKASVQDPEIKKFISNIISSQQVNRRDETKLKKLKND